MLTHPPASRFLAALALLAVLLAGCGKKPANQTQKAEAAVEKVLDSWARGESPEKFAKAGQPIQASDPDWKAGSRLLSFLVAESKQSQEKPGRVRCRVALSLQDRQGKKIDREVVYDVAVGDTILIGRATR